jgi:hypothetical protein
MQKDILENKMIKKALDNYIPPSRNWTPRIRDTRPFKKFLTEFTVVRHPLYGLKATIGERLIYKIRKELGVK